MSALRWEGRALYRDGYPHHLRCINYGNVPIGQSTTEWVAEYDQLLYDLVDIAHAGFNCIKIYVNLYTQPAYDAAMAACTAAGIDVIALYYVSYNKDYTTTSGASNRTATIDGFTTMISKIRSYPAVIGYGFGNENNYNLGSTTTLGDWYQLLNDACAAGKLIDSSRFYFTSNGEVSTIIGADNLVPYLDIWGATVYRGTSFGTLYTTMQQSTRKPFILTEWGSSRLNTTTLQEDESGQASVIRSQLLEIEAHWPQVAGFVHFQHADGWAKAGNPSVHDLNSEEWWGVSVAVDPGHATPRQRKRAFKTIDTILTKKTYLLDASGNFLVDIAGNNIMTVV